MLHSAAQCSPWNEKVKKTKRATADSLMTVFFPLHWKGCLAYSLKQSLFGMYKVYEMFPLSGADRHPRSLSQPLRCVTFVSAWWGRHSVKSPNVLDTPWKHFTCLGHAGLWKQAKTDGCHGQTSAAVQDHWRRENGGTEKRMDLRVFSFDMDFFVFCF